MSWMASEKPYDKRRRPKKVGRPKEENGHKRIDISLCASIVSYLEEVDNKSRFIEKAIRKCVGSKKHYKNHLHFYAEYPKIGFGISALRPIDSKAPLYLNIVNLLSGERNSCSG
jgi:hypothetical protein